MSTRVMLVNPPPHRRVDQYDEPDFGRLGLACLAGEVRARRVGPVGIVDAKLESLDLRELSSRIRAFKPDIVGLTAMTNEILPAAAVAESIKSISPSIVTVIGGVHVSVLPEETLREFPHFDYGVVGEGEATLIELIDALASQESVERVPGLVIRLDGTPKLTASRPRVKNLDEFANPAWDLLPPTKRYLVSTQRGCPFHCPFCVNPNGTLVRQRSIERVIEELKDIAFVRRAETLYFCDEVFSLDKERTHELLDAFMGARLQERLNWTAATHVNFVDRDLFRKMKDSGCTLCEVGIETGDSSIMGGLGKALSIDRIKEARREAAEVGLPFGALMILGHPEETRETARSTIDLAVELNCDQTIFGIMVPFPGTEVARLARREEGGYRLIAKSWNDYGKQHGHALELRDLSRFQLEALQLSGYVEVLARNARYRDLASFAWRFRREGLSIVRKLGLKVAKKALLVGYPFTNQQS